MAEDGEPDFCWEVADSKMHDAKASGPVVESRAMSLRKSRTRQE